MPAFPEPRHTLALTPSDMDSEYFEETFSENQKKEKGNPLGKKRLSSCVIWKPRRTLAPVPDYDLEITTPDTLAL